MDGTNNKTWGAMSGVLTFHATRSEVPNSISSVWTLAMSTLTRQLREASGEEGKGASHLARLQCPFCILVWR